MLDRLRRWAKEFRSQWAVSGPPMDPVIAEWASGGEGTAGVDVTPDTALNISAVWRAVSLIAGSVGSLPIELAEHGDGSVTKVPEHPALDLLNFDASDEYDSFAFREAMTAQALLHGLGVAEKIFDRDRVIALAIMDPSTIEAKRDDSGRLQYWQGDDPYDPSDLFLLHGMGFDGTRGYSVVDYARRSLGLTAAGEQLGASLFENGSRPGGTLEYPGKLKPQTKEKIRQAWERMHQGAGKAHRVAVLEEGMKFSPFTIPPNDAQFLETRQFQVVEIARWFGVPPHLLYDLSHATYSNIEAQSLEFIAFGLRYWLRRWERAIERQLLTPEERKGRKMRAEHQVDDLAVADLNTRATFYRQALETGWLSVNEIRGREKLNPIQNGDLHALPLHLATIEQGKAVAPIDPKPILEILAAFTNRSLSRPAAAALIAAAAPTLPPEAIESMLAPEQADVDVGVPREPVPAPIPKPGVLSRVLSAFSRR